ncbi:hypothetical protein [Arcticibacter sp. MXS-1]|uniref:hypothetical protein n=1 Tax=Arcticibacter sp. MXS-1 TaxID=3341726 RepID=UPI0035A95CD5
MIKPMKAIPSIIPNLNDLSGGASAVAEDDSPKYISGDSREPFTSSEMLTHWNAYAMEIKQAGKINLFTLMTSNAPVLLPNHQIEVTIENKIQDNLLSIEKVDLLNYLRVRLKNFATDIVTRHAEKNEKRKLYTAHEKYQHMVEKNPQLEEFRRRFNLEIG